MAQTEPRLNMIASDLHEHFLNYVKPKGFKAISAVLEEKNKLETAHNNLWKIFEGISKNETNADVWQEKLRKYNTRKNFYEKLSAFAKLVDFMFSSYELFEAVGDKKAEE